MTASRPPTSTFSTLHLLYVTGTMQSSDICDTIMSRPRHEPVFYYWGWRASARRKFYRFDHANCFMENVFVDTDCTHICQQFRTRLIGLIPEIIRTQVGYTVLMTRIMLTYVYFTCTHSACNYQSISPCRKDSGSESARQREM